MNRRILILRPEPGASATAARAGERGLEPILLPLFEIVPRAWRAPGERFDAMLMTSANAARHAGPGLKPFTYLPLYTVGDATAHAARDAGFADVTVSGPDVMAAFDRLRADGQTTVLHLAGEHRTDAEPAGFRVSTVAVYSSQPVEPPPALIAAASAVALLHSARAARRFVACVDAQRIGRERVRVAAISPAVAGAAGDGWRAVSAVATPTDDALLDLAARMCD